MYGWPLEPNPQVWQYKHHALPPEPYRTRIQDLWPQVVKSSQYWPHMVTHKRITFNQDCFLISVRWNVFLRLMYDMLCCHIFSFLSNFVHQMWVWHQNSSYRSLKYQEECRKVTQQLQWLSLSYLQNPNSCALWMRWRLYHRNTIAEYELGGLLDGNGEGIVHRLRGLNPAPSGFHFNKLC
jgi:hypothetical protein